VQPVIERSSAIWQRARQRRNLLRGDAGAPCHRSPPPAGQHVRIRLFRELTQVAIAALRRGGETGEAASPARLPAACLSRPRRGQRRAPSAMHRPQSGDLRQRAMPITVRIPSASRPGRLPAATAAPVPPVRPVPDQAMDTSAGGTVNFTQAAFHLRAQREGREEFLSGDRFKFGQRKRRDSNRAAGMTPVCRACDQSCRYSMGDSRSVPHAKPRVLRPGGSTSPGFAG
jgi:hypothetical protein